MADFAWDKYRVFNTGRYKVIYFHQDLVGAYVPDNELFASELNDVFNVVLRYYRGTEIARKYHPAHELNKNIVTVGEELPVYIPAELLSCDQVQMWLGISSTAIANVRRGQAISVIDLITYRDPRVRAGFKERLIKRSLSKILFPSSLEDLNEMVRNIHWEYH